MNSACQPSPRACALLVAWALSVGCVVSGCVRETAPAPPERSQAGPAEAVVDFAEQVDEALGLFHQDASMPAENRALADLIWRGADRGDIYTVLRERAERQHLDVLCILDGDGKTWMRASSVENCGGTELWDNRGFCEDGMCANLRLLIWRAMKAPSQSRPSIEIYPAELLRLERMLDFRVRDLRTHGVDETLLENRDLASAVAVGTGASRERRALMMLDVSPLETRTGKAIGTVVAGWLLSRTSTLPDSFHQATGLHASFYLSETRVASSLDGAGGDGVLGTTLSQDAWGRVRRAEQCGMTALDLGYGPVDASFLRLMDATDRPIGALMVEAAANPEAVGAASADGNAPTEPQEGEPPKEDNGQ